MIGLLFFCFNLIFYLICQEIDLHASNKTEQKKLDSQILGDSRVASVIFSTEFELKVILILPIITTTTTTKREGEVAGWGGGWGGGVKPHSEHCFPAPPSKLCQI